MFEVGDRVQVPERADQVPSDIRGKKGTVLRLIPPAPVDWEQQYLVEFEDGRASFVRESWLVTA